MKTAKLIELLQKADPTGEEECCVGNSPIVDAISLPSYYDGYKQTLIENEQGEIIAAKYSTIGRKISLYFMSIIDVLLDKPDLPVDYSEIENEQSQLQYKNRVEKERLFVYNLNCEIDCEMFSKYIDRRFNTSGEYDMAAIISPCSFISY